MMTRDEAAAAGNEPAAWPGARRWSPRMAGGAAAGRWRLRAAARPGSVQRERRAADPARPAARPPGRSRPRAAASTGPPSPRFGLTNNMDPMGETQIGFALRRSTTPCSASWSASGTSAARRATQIVPDLATSVPTPTDGGLTYTFHLKSDIKFAPPVNREITSKRHPLRIPADQRLQARRAVRLLLRRGHRGMTGKATSPNNYISGIQTPNPTTIIFHLTKPTGDFLQRIASPAAAPVPAEVAKCFNTAGGYGRDLVASGPYMFQGSAPGEHLQLQDDQADDRLRPDQSHDPGAQPKLRAVHRQHPRQLRQRRRDHGGPERRGHLRAGPEGPARRVDDRPAAGDGHPAVPDRPVAHQGLPLRPDQSGRVTSR